jgi:hypothetical protein
MKDKLLALIKRLEEQHDFENEFYLTYTGQLNDGDISDWYNSHFDDNVELGFSTGETSMAEDIIAELTKIIEEN